jgi:hypothetical protein
MTTRFFSRVREAELAAFRQVILMRILGIAAVATALSLGSVAGSQTVSAAPPDVVLSWTVSPGTFANGIWTIPGTTTLTASVVDEFGHPITEGELVWQTCRGTGADLGTHHSAADCQQSGSVRWRDAAIIPDPANPTPISPCLCAGDQQGFRLTYRSRGSGFRSTTGAPFDLFAESSCPMRPSCP